ncbi:MAG: LysM peptidoglycan-binding domain-containing protein [Caldilinea sp.]|uniref:LysM peptidoglycan-binding domain-containing protein n=1 Tax=Caldilinea sp. TaxID=2293560 RepID=UPI0030AF3C31
MQAQTPNPDKPRVPVSSHPAGDLRSAATRLCPTCNSSVSIHASVCPVCGDALPSRTKQVRCRRCGKKASSALVICPHCGRELHPAPPRLLTWGAPLALVALFGAAFLVQLGSASPTHWALRQVDRAVAFVAAIGDQLQPDLTITLGASAEGEEDGLLSQPQVVTLSDASAQPEEDVAAQGDAENTQSMTTSAEDAAPEGEAAAAAEAESPPVEEQAPPETPTEAPTATPTNEPTATPTSTSEPTSTPTPQSTPGAASANPTSIGQTTPSATLTVTSTLGAGGEPTSQPLVASSAATTTPTATGAPALTLLLPTPTPPAPTPTPRIHIIRAGDTLFEIAMANGVSLSALLAANGLTENDVYTIQPGDEIIIPDPNAPVEVAATPTPIQGNFTYTVQPGDTLMAIGMRFGVNLQRILDANNLTLAQARTLRPGQQLIIPGDAPSASPTPTSTPTLAVAPSPTPAPAASAFRLDAPTLRAPENQVSVKCGASEQLVWNPVPSIQSADLYVVHLGYVNGRNAGGAEQIVWVIQQQRPSNVTLWRLDDTLCGLAPLEFGRQWRWYVQVVARGADGALTPVSPPSEMWGFTWQ